jgi:hypothetical protein
MIALALLVAIIFASPGTSGFSLRPQLWGAGHCSKVQASTGPGSFSGSALGNVVSRLLAYFSPYTNCPICRHFTNIIAPRLNQRDLGSCLLSFNYMYKLLQILHPVEPRTSILASNVSGLTLPLSPVKPGFC